MQIHALGITCRDQRGDVVPHPSQNGRPHAPFFPKTKESNGTQTPRVPHLFIPKCEIFSKLQLPFVIVCPRTQGVTKTIKTPAPPLFSLSLSLASRRDQISSLLLLPWGRPLCSRSILTSCRPAWSRHLPKGSDTRTCPRTNKGWKVWFDIGGCKHESTKLLSTS